MGSLSSVNLGAIERQLRPCAFEQLRPSTSTRKPRFKEPACLDPLSSLPFELFSQICLDLKPGVLFTLSLINQSLFFKLRTCTAHAEAL
ncbi:hypothetical protein JCM10207_008117 [Rhodosporidiobolus poonsookiae]